MMPHAGPLVVAAAQWTGPAAGLYSETHVSSSEWWLAAECLAVAAVWYSVYRHRRPDRPGRRRGLAARGAGTPDPR